VDDINQRTPCELQIQYKGLLNTVAYAIAMPTQPGKVYHGQPILTRYARVGVEEECKNYEKLELDIPRSDGETKLEEAIHGWILWEKPRHPQAC
jgi:hypothetical protein